ncbi:uncharacterized protein LOC114260567 [Camellia sinensis]|uniref:uncharacterized protein LOC114260567 n=1 Tax=Camellia sinensis TaxID=4442 RepID=UPI0010365788|nr:uncharacterized protein LOC114260567 [Camellia sinensis]
MTITGDDPAGISSLQQFLCHQFEMKDLGFLSYFLSLEISQDSSVGSLVYLTATCPDIAYTVHIVSQFKAAPRFPHYDALIRILCYLKGTLFHGLHYSGQSSLQLHAFTDANWEGNPTDRRFTTGFYFFLGNSLIAWHSNKQTLVARSSTETEYRALADIT